MKVKFEIDKDFNLWPETLNLLEENSESTSKYELKPKLPEAL